MPVKSTLLGSASLRGTESKEKQARGAAQAQVKAPDFGASAPALASGATPVSATPAMAPAK